jgi:hypothetical protein
MNLRNRQQLLGLLAIAAVGLLAGDRLVFSPLVRSWKERSRRITELQRAVTQGTQLLERESAIRTRWEQMRTNALSGEVSVAQSQVLQAFDRWSRDSGVSIGSIRPQWKGNADEALTLECRADASGNLSALTRFLYELENDPLAVKVDSVEITAQDSNGQQLTMAVQVSGLLLPAPETR